MKMYFTTDGSVDEQLQQVCPFGQLHHFKRNDGSEFTMRKYVGCGGCAQCLYCYGKGHQNYYKNSFVLIPQVFETNHFSYEAGEKYKSDLGLKQFKAIQKNDYIKCALCYTEEYRKKCISLKIKIWWWHKVGIHINDIRSEIECKYYNIKFKVNDCFNKWFKRV